MQHLFKIQRDQLAKDEEDLRESFLAINTQKEKDRVTFATKTRSLADPPDYRGKDGKQRLLCERQHQKAKAQRIGPRPWGFVSMDLNSKGEIYANRSQAQGPMPAFFKKVYGSKARVYKTKTTTKSPVTVTPRPGVRLRGF